MVRILRLTSAASGNEKTLMFNRYDIRRRLRRQPSPEKEQCCHRRSSTYSYFFSNKTKKTACIALSHPRSIGETAQLSDVFGLLRIVFLFWLFRIAHKNQKLNNQNKQLHSIQIQTSQSLNQQTKMDHPKPTSTSPSTKKTAQCPYAFLGHPRPMKVTGKQGWEDMVYINFKP